MSDSNVYDFSTGEPTEGTVIEPRQGTETIIEMLGQRKHQILDIALVWIEADGGIRFGTSVTPNVTLLGMIDFLHDRILRDDDATE